MAIAGDVADLLLKSAPLGNNSGVLIDVTVESAGWEFCGLTVVKLAPGETWSRPGNEDEIALVPLGGRCTVTSGGQEWTIGERSNPFTGQPWAVYLPLGRACEVRAESPLELAVCSARATRELAPKVVTPDSVKVEIRGGGNAARQINHIIEPSFEADRLLIVEVFTPSGNWSSYPPHKHDVHDMPREADLEEIYYYRISPPDGFGLQRLYTGDGTTDAAYVIHDGDLLLVPEGYHAFAVAQGYTGYYLNVLAGDEPVRTMQPKDDPAYTWVRGTWSDERNAGLRSWRDIEDRVNGPAGRLPG
ncbi:MAG: 5-deoxy-glucuronate isomerase [Thermomicrobiales bacterium]